MPRFYQDPTTEVETDTETRADGSRLNSSATRILHWRPLLVVTFAYYFISCGIERIYQPMVKKNINGKKMVKMILKWYKNGKKLVNFAYYFISCGTERIY